MVGMPLTLVLGPANSAKAGEVLGAFAAAARRGALLVVPTAADAAHYARELAARGDGARVGAHVRRPGARDRAAGRLRRATAVGAAARAGARAGGRGGPLPGAARARPARPGSPSAAGDLIAELRALAGHAAARSPRRCAPGRGGLAPGRATRATSRRSTGPTRARSSGCERVDAELFAWRALDALRAAPGRWGDEPVFFYGFDDLHPLERDAIETLARVVGVEVTVSLTYEAGRAGASAPGPRWSRSCGRWPSGCSSCRRSDEHYDARLAGGRCITSSAGCSSPRRRACEPGEAVALLEAGGERAEAELVAARGARAAAGGHARRGDRGREPLARRQRGADRAGVRAATASRSRSSASGRRSATRRSAAGCSALARCALLGPHERGPRTCSTICARRGCSISPELADRLEAEVRRRGLRTAPAGRARWLGWTLGEIDALRVAEDPGAELARQARRLFAAPHRGRAPVLDPAEELDARALAALERALSELERART